MFLHLWAVNREEALELTIGERKGHSNGAPPHWALSFKYSNRADSNIWKGPTPGDLHSDDGDRKQLKTVATRVPREAVCRDSS